jgi:small-conductance mechanosensitive channel
LAKLSAALGPIIAAVPTIPTQLASAWRMIGGSNGLASAIVVLAIIVAAMLGAAWAGRTWVRRSLLPNSRDGGSSAVLRRFLVDLAGWLAAAAVAILGVEIADGGGELAAKLHVAAIDLVLLVMAALLAPSILLRPAEPELRLVAADDASIARATPWAISALVIALSFPTLIPVFLDAGMAWPAGQALALILGFVVGLLGLIAGWRFVAGHDDAPRLRRLIAGLALGFVLAWGYGVVTLDFPFYFLMVRLAGLLTLGFVLDRLIVRALRAEEAAAAAPVAEAAAADGQPPKVWRNYAAPLRRVLAVLVASIAILVAALWLVDVAPGWIDQARLDVLRANVAGALTVMNIGYAAFEGLSAWTRARYVSQIAPQLPGSDDEAVAPTSRLATVLPVVQGIIGFVVLGISALYALSRLGVDITPILAGAGILGLAVSFGSQSLVRDVVAGVFYMIDDAFRLGEYVEAGRLKGSVERISIRSVQLRHHNGMLHTVPFGQLGSITNYSRDWITLKFNLRLARDIDIDAVRKLVKRIGLEMLDDPELGKEFILPLKMQGVADVTENALVVRFKFTARPGKPTYLQREAIKRMIKAFQAEGVRFAQNAVVVQTSQEPEAPEVAAMAIAVSERHTGHS